MGLLRRLKPLGYANHCLRASRFNGNTVFIRDSLLERIRMTFFERTIVDDEKQGVYYNVELKEAYRKNEINPSESSSALGPMSP